ncbi:hypothetical protein EGW08_007929 [Elysia chlorotica]|uniref:Uncharacterized protein n=1 Tax=Elysia chlorotica TaxID=188477 RepID=A0A433TRR1_ELYCH|nr:hypothetical protein EGW08_007929 [Elysia chlorotica]
MEVHTQRRTTACLAFLVTVEVEIWFLHMELQKESIYSSMVHHHFLDLDGGGQVCVNRTYTCKLCDASLQTVTFYFGSVQKIVIAGPPVLYFFFISPLKPVFCWISEIKRLSLCNAYTNLIYKWAQLDNGSSAHECSKSKNKFFGWKHWSFCKKSDNCRLIVIYKLQATHKTSYSQEVPKKSSHSQLIHVLNYNRNYLEMAEFFRHFL